MQGAGDLDCLVLGAVKVVRLTEGSGATLRKSPATWQESGQMEERSRELKIEVWKNRVILSHKKGTTQH